MSDVTQTPPAGRTTEIPWIGLAWAALAVMALALGAILWFWPEISAWATARQREAQTLLAQSLQAVRAGDAAAIWTLIGACGLYGLVHAVGPGHGKVLISGAALASRRAAWRMAGIGFAASLTQAATAILLIYGALGLFSATTGWATGMAEQWLAPLSFLAIAVVGLWIVRRGVRTLRRLSASDDERAHAHDHPGECHAGCRHAPTAEEVTRAETWWDVAALIGSIGARPCSGALIVLAIAWQFELYALGIAGAVAMAAGTGIVVAGSALAATMVRDAGGLRADRPDRIRLFAAVQIAAGLLIAAASLSMIGSGLGGPAPGGLLR